MTWNLWLAIGAINGLISVAAGAFGAHGLKKVLEPADLSTFEVAVRYQMYHAFALIAVAWLVSRNIPGPTNAAGWCFLAGIVIFCGTVYAIPLTGIKILGAITPIGGVLLMIGWLCVAIAGFKAAS